MGSIARERPHLSNSRLTREVEDIVQQQLNTFKTAYDMEFQEKLTRGQDEAYRRGKKDAETKDLDHWLPTVDPRLVERAKKLEFIDLSEIKAVLSRSKGKEKTKEKAIFKIDEATGNLKVDEEAVPKDKEAIKWLEWQALFADLMNYYLIHGGHLEKTADMLTYFRLMQRLGQEGIFTFESLQVMDFHIRSRKEGQGENFTWKMDDGPSRWLYLREYRPPTAKERTPAAKPKKRSRGACYDWLQGAHCKFGEKNCKFAHQCSFCKTSAPKSHVLDSCPNKISFEAVFKKPKHRKD